MKSDTREYIVCDTQVEVPGVVTINLKERGGGVPMFVPGQYINVYFPELSTPEGKAYSISNEPGENTFNITVRGIGKFSNRLCDMKRGDIFSGSLPYGFFSPEHAETDVMMLAAGIGITPFRSIIHHTATRNPLRRLSLFHSVRTAGDAIFREDLQRLKGEMPNFSVVHFITREEAPAEPDTYRGRMEAGDIMRRVRNMAITEFLVCGPISFTRDMWKSLRTVGVPEESIYTEAFFS